jgi:hypothetical protein
LLKILKTFAIERKSPMESSVSKIYIAYLPCNIRLVCHFATNKVTQIIHKKHDISLSDYLPIVATTLMPYPLIHH